MLCATRASMAVHLGAIRPILDRSQMEEACELINGCEEVSELSARVVCSSEFVVRLSHETVMGRGQGADAGRCD